MQENSSIPLYEKSTIFQQPTKNEIYHRTDYRTGTETSQRSEHREENHVRNRLQVCSKLWGLALLG